MDMSGHAHNHGGNAGLGFEINYTFARAFWFLVVAAVGLAVAVRIADYFVARQRLRACADPAFDHSVCARPTGPVSQAWATATALAREAGLPQISPPAIPGLRWAAPPPLGRVLLLLIYWAVVIYLMSYNVVHYDVYYWERIGYRNAWISVAQLPLIYLLATKCNPVGWLVGCGHERLNWLHRWVARTMLITATVHGFHFWTEWERADFVAYELAAMPLVKYGLGAWGVLLWTVVVGFVPVRRLAYEVWLLQHIVSAIVMLWLLHRHIPANARYLLWMSVGFFVWDRVARGLLLLWRNVPWSFTPQPSSVLQGLRQRRCGHDMTLRLLGEDVTVVTVRGVRFGWRPGQHVYLWVPRLGPLEAHPYTVAGARDPSGNLQLVVRARGGFSRRLCDFAARHPDRILTAFVSGPFGVPPRWDIYETLVLMGASTGASFVLPLLESIAVAVPGHLCARRVELTLVARTAAEIDFYLFRAKDAARRARRRGIRVLLHVALTGQDAGQPLLQHQSLSEESAAKKTDGHFVDEPSSSSPSGDGVDDDDGDYFICQYAGRPDVEALIREPVEEAWGEAAVMVCGGRELIARTRNCVSRLSDERAVHKGTGAQGIYLHAEEYAF
ncbi:Ferric/cupric reductase transmembrane component 7 [Ophiocordyceps camponoti-floridani]|uniref:ferric-chelate reductase (NADPH) n=1 Tax=Ophiocordyceps camponoti-floridani TaxID=2030778 RepID=A0A8H4Q0G8_9HYPO|nr:Ferric/cupric reductase transmembrane component 7 [Ophiocordyceps camponoti-floridani]